MKRNPRFNGLVISVALSAVLTGCGGLDSAIDDIKNEIIQEIKNASIEGKAVDGYLQYATVCLDLNQDGYCQSSEPSTQTNEDGKFTLEVSAKIQAQKGYEKAMLLVYGGKDVDTGVDFNGKLLAPKDGNIVNITPITTLVAKAVQKELNANKHLTQEQIREKIKASRKRVAQALDIHEDDMGKDPVAEQKAGREDLIRKALQLQKAVEAMLVAGDNEGRGTDERAEGIYEAFIDGLNDMAASERGIDKLLDRTFQIAQHNERVKALIGGDEGVKLGDAAKKVAKNIHDRFEKFDPQARQKDDFLEKIAAITKDDLKKVKIEYDNGSDNIAGQISIDDSNPMFQYGFDWDAKFIKDDLHHLGFEKPSDELIQKIKELFNGHEKIKPGILFIKKERLRHADDQELKDLYLRIKKFEARLKSEKERQEAKRENNIVKINPPMSIFTPEDKGYGKVTFNTDNTLTFQKFEVQEDGTFALEQKRSEDAEFIYNGGVWQTDNEDSETFRIDASGAIILPKWHEKAYLVNPKDISGDTREIPDLGLDVTMPEGAKMSFIKIEKIDDTYSLHEAVKNYNTNSNYSSISEFIKQQCGTSWFMGDDRGGLAFAPTQISSDSEYSCDPQASKGELITAYTDNSKESHMGRIAGKWEIKQLDGDVKVLIVKPYDLKKFEGHDEGVHFPIFAVKDGKLYRGSLEPKGTEHAFPAFNETAMKAISTAITKNWEDIKDEFRSDDEYSGEQYDESLGGYYSTTDD
jgi:hypothetical protein